MKTTYSQMTKTKFNWTTGAVLLIAVLIIGVHTGYLSGAATSADCTPTSLTVGQSTTLYGNSVHLINVIGAGTISMKVNDKTVIATLDNVPTVEGISIEVVDTRFTPELQNRVASVIICKNA